MANPSSASNRLAAAVIVKHADDELRVTLASIASTVDQIVVHATVADDEVRQVAREFGATWVEAAWSDDYSAARNACLTHVEANWVLWLEAGESLSETDAVNLQRFIKTEASAENAYMMIVMSPAAQGDVDGEQIGQIRLAPLHPEVQFRYRVRESLSPAVSDLELSVDGVPYRIRRSPRVHDADYKDRVARREIRLADLEIAQSGPTARMLNCLGEAHQTLGDLARSVSYYRQALESSEPGSSDMLEAYYGLLSSMERSSAHDDEQLPVCLQALEAFPLDVQLLCAMGGYLQKQGRIELAGRSYRTASQFGVVHPQVWHVGTIHEIAAVCHALTLQLLQRDAEARDALESALERYPDSQQIRERLIALLIKHGELEPALAVVDETSLDDPHASALKTAIRGACLASRQEWAAAAVLLKDAFEAGCRDPLCLRWYTISLLGQSLLAEAQPILRAWRELQPNDAEARKYDEAVRQVMGRTSPANDGAAPIRRVDHREEEVPRSLPNALVDIAPAPGASQIAD